MVCPQYGEGAALACIIGGLANRAAGML